MRVLIRETLETAVINIYGTDENSTARTSLRSILPIRRVHIPPLMKNVRSSAQMHSGR